MDYSPPDSSVHGILQARVLEWVAMPSSRDSNLPNSGIKPASLMSPAFAGGFFTTSATWEAPIASICHSIPEHSAFGVIIEGKLHGSK